MPALITGEDHAVALVEANSGRSVSYRELKDLLEDRAAELTAAAGEGLAILRIGRTVNSVIDLLSARHAGIPVILIDPEKEADQLADLVERFKPSLVVDADGSLHAYADHAAIKNDAGVEVLLQTSGSTGNPKLVQLTSENLNSNAVDIATALSLSADDNGLAHLSFYYSYGMSILHSHLAVGGTTVISSSSPVQPEFWEQIVSYGVTGIPGVPYSYEMYRRTGVDKHDLTSLRYMSQAGGKMKPALVKWYRELLSAKEIGLYVMYGQTEAAPRMSTLPATELADYPDSVGYAMASGSFTIIDPDSEGRGEVRYEGPNVMVGYASDASAIGQVSHSGALETGDVGYLDEAGRLYITGRLKRFAKLFGMRINLDDIEARFGNDGALAAVEHNNKIMIFTEDGADTESLKATAKELEQMLKVPPNSIKVETVPELPLSANGKIDRRKLTGE